VKKLLILVILLCAALACSAQEVIVANAIIIAWDAVTTLVDGTQIPAGDTVDYQVFIALNKDVPIDKGRTNGEVQHAISFDQEGTYFVGVRAIRIHNNEESISEIAWSDDPEHAETPFVIMYLLPPNDPGGIRVVKVEVIIT
jgi:hypothetical protein